MSKDTNKKVMSIAIQPEVHDKLKDFCNIKGVSISSLLGKLAEQSIKLNPDDDIIVVGKPTDENVIPIVLKVPSSLKGDEDSLRNWMNVQTNGIIKALTGNK